MAVREFECEFCIHGYHIYKEIWNSTVGEHLESNEQIAMLWQL